MAFDILLWWMVWRRLPISSDRSKKKSSGAGVLAGYGITDGYDNDLDDDDQERSRGIPSRTGLGKRGSIIEKFPTLGTPLTLFGGLITIPFWGYLNTPIALLEVMLSDLPHVMYHPPVATQEEMENRVIVSKQLREQIKKGGLRSVAGLNLNFNNIKKTDKSELMELKKR